MLKGVNKKVIEINDTRNIYFEKAVLYVRPEMLDTPHSHLVREANYYLEENTVKNITPYTSAARISHMSKIALITSGITAAAGIIIFFIISGMN